MSGLRRHGVTALNRQQRGRLPRTQRRREQAGVGVGRGEQVGVSRRREGASAAAQEHIRAPRIVEPRVGRKDEDRRYREPRSRRRAGSDIPAADGYRQTGECPVASVVSGLRAEVARCSCFVGSLKVRLFVADAAVLG